MSHTDTHSFKIRLMIRSLFAAWQDAYDIEKSVSVDGCMIAFKGRMYMRPKKPSNGVRMAGCCLAQTAAMRITGCCIPEKKTTMQLSDLGGVWGLYP